MLLEEEEAKGMVRGLRIGQIRTHSNIAHTATRTLTAPQIVENMRNTFDEKPRNHRRNESPHENRPPPSHDQQPRREDAAPR